MNVRFGVYLLYLFHLEEGMRREVLAASSLCIGIATLAMCGGSATSQCTPGQSIGCVGVGGCSGYQTCNALGSYDSCICGGQDGGGPDGSPNDAGIDVVMQDSAAESTTTTDGATWSPANISGLVLWLNDDVGLIQDSQKPGYVKHWLDQSGNGNDANACTVGCSDPAYDQAAIHGHDAIICGGTGALMEVPDSSSLQFGTGDFAIAMVVRIGTPETNVSAYYYWRKFDTQTGYGIQLTEPMNSNNLDFIDYNKTITVDLAATTYVGKWDIVILTGQAMALSIGADTYAGPTAGYDVSAVGMPSVFCEALGGAEIAEVLAVKGTLSSSDEANLHAYFATKFGLP